MKKLLVIVLVAFCMMGCFSKFPTYEPPKCEQTTYEEKTEAVKKAISFFRAPNYIDITNESIAWNDKSLIYKDVTKIRLKEKSYHNIKKTKYWILFYDNNNKEEFIYLNNKIIALRAYNALLCLTGLNNTNTKALEQPTVTESKPAIDKYDQLAKLKELLDNGAINQEEYEKEKAKILE